MVMTLGEMSGEILALVKLNSKLTISQMAVKLNELASIRVVVGKLLKIRYVHKRYDY